MNRVFPDHNEDRGHKLDIVSFGIKVGVRVRLCVCTGLHREKANQADRDSVELYRHINMGHSAIKIPGYLSLEGFGPGSLWWIRPDSIEGL